MSAPAELIIADADGSEIMRAAVDEDGKPTLFFYDSFDFLVPTTLDAGGAAALCDWLTTWLERREAVQP